MEKIEEYAEEESPNTETKQMSKYPVLEEITAHSSKLIQTIKDLKTKMESVKKDNERILKTQEELNQILIEKFQTEGRSKRSESEETSHQKGSKKMKLVKAESSSSSEGIREQQSYYTTSDSSEAELYTERKSTSRTKRFPGSSKK